MTNYRISIRTEAKSPLARKRKGLAFLYPDELVFKMLLHLNWAIFEIAADETPNLGSLNEDTLPMASFFFLTGIGVFAKN